MAGKAFVTSPTFTKPRPSTGLTNTQSAMDYEVTAGDGVAAPLLITGGRFTFDAALTPAQNLAALKNSVIALCANYGIILATTDVSVFTAIN
jgi:hypothetical protein